MNTTLTPCENATQDSDQATSECQVERQTIRPRADIYEVDDAWFIVLEMPGVDQNGADVSFEKGVLNVSGEVDAFATEGFEQRFGDFAARRFERSFRLPEEVDTSGIDAEVKSGVLKLRLPKAPAALPHKVTVKAG